MRIEIMDGENVLNVITASEDFAEAHYPGRWRLAAVQDQPQAPVYADVIQQKIDQLEQESLMNRITRESIRTMALERAAALGLTEAQLIAKNKGYAALKQVDDEIAALRAQL